MSSPRTIRFKIPVARRRSRAAPGATEPPSPTTLSAASPPGPSRAARMLALAHYVERLVEAGELTGYAEAARSLGVTRARLTQLEKLTLLAPVIQEQILFGSLRDSERRLRRLLREAEWCLQQGAGSASPCAPVPASSPGEPTERGDFACLPLSRVTVPDTVE